MKVRPMILTAAAVGVFGLIPLASQAADRDSLQRCMDVFAAQYFPDNQLNFVIDEGGRMSLPLIAQSGTQSVQLVATAKSDGRFLGRTTCQVRDMGNSEGRVTVMPLESGGAN